MLIVSTFLFYQPQNNINCNVHAFKTIQQQQQQQQSDSQNTHIPTNHHNPHHHQQQQHRSLSSTTTTTAAAASNTPFKATHAAITMDSFTITPTRRGSSRGTTSTTVGTSTEKTNFKIVPSLGFGGNNGAAAAVAPYTLNEAEGVTAYDPDYYYHHHHHHHHHSQLTDDDDDDDEELMGLGTALVTCAMSLVIGFALGYGT